ncbi:hypothetical protein A3759_12170 [Thalassolituus sp. HI0120]|nr:hypothetical protein A3759_14095 [Thalassolituus sp. HI0120]KZZ44125.1 hypothetical protein A3759_12170 [Thalassolituus sp. HI0120]
MHLFNFSIAKDNIALENKKNYFDLHNNFAFTSMNFDVTERTVNLSWLRRDESWVHENDTKKIELQFEGVSLFKIKERGPDELYSEDDCLNTIGFIHNELMEEMEAYSNNVATEHENHLNI